MKVIRPQTLVAATVIWALTFCAPPVGNAKGAKLLVSWKNPDYSGQKPHRILVIGMSENPEVRADFEDDLSSVLANDGLEVIPGNTILFRPQSAELEPDYLRGQIRDFKIDAILVSRLVKVDKKTTYIPGHSYTVPYAYYGSFYGYYGTIYRQVYTPDYLREDTTVRVETNFYAATPPDGELIWTATSDSFNPKSAQKVIDGVVKLIVKELTKQKLL
ncbi:MAG: hypothetical protein WAK24_04665 [Candidatus Acidiferrales bacterium]